VQIDLLYEIQIPAPHDARSEQRAFHQALEQIAAADRAGFSCVWAVEHHFLTEFAHSSAPEVFLAAPAMRTERIPSCSAAT
jgi:alkanesulfonate monooxygenase SsuD/methylene tetrahydromethanopterin reductase-like flavin-dependent oxidoreductase (luciferase family)